MLSVNSISTLLVAFSTQLQMTPSIAAIQAWTSVLDEIEEVPDLDDEEVSKHLMLNVTTIIYSVCLPKMTIELLHGHCTDERRVRKRDKKVRRDVI